MASLLKGPGRVVVGVPNELYLMALVKGLFRMGRRYGAFDARWSTVLPATTGKPDPDRPIQDIDGLPFIYPHTGFDYRRVPELAAAAKLTIERVATSPLRGGPKSLSSEIYMTFRRVEG